MVEQDRDLLLRDVAVDEPASDGVPPLVGCQVHGDAVLSGILSSRRRHTRFDCDWSSDVCSSDLVAVGAAKALDRLGTQGVAVKWPNDLYCEEHKLGGILIESSGAVPGPSTVIVGVGINEIGRASGRERGEISVVAVSLKKKVKLA